MAGPILTVAFKREQQETLLHTMVFETEAFPADVSLPA